MESRKVVLMNLYAEQQWKFRQKAQICGPSGEGEGETTENSNTETYITICKVDSQWEFGV